MREPRELDWDTRPSSARRTGGRSYYRLAERPDGKIAAAIKRRGTVKRLADSAKFRASPRGVRHNRAERFGDQSTDGLCDRWREGVTDLPVHRVLRSEKCQAGAKPWTRSAMSFVRHDT